MMSDAWVQLENQRYPYQFTHSKRAKYLRLKLAQNGDLSVVVPVGVSLKQARLFVESQVEWLERKLPELSGSDCKHSAKPETLHLQYFNELWVLDYVGDSSAGSVIIQPDTMNQSLKCSGLIDHSEPLKKAIGLWLKDRAESVIPQRLSELAEFHGFHYQKVTIRGQKTRWGSCSSQKNISLNYKLLFLPHNMVDYVLIHELCHTIEMNHSKRFWSLVADCDANYREHDKALNQYAKQIPL